jgi:predicted enzyme related to lactoylglutathione lyase
MGRRTTYTPGTPCWVDLTTTDVEAAQRFYGAVFGWTVMRPTRPVGNYLFFEHEGETVAGFQPLMDAQREQGMPPSWSMYVHTEDALATVARATELGATVVVEPFEIPGAGRMSALGDPQGGVVLLWEPGEFAGAQLVNAIGAWAWNDLQAKDPEGAAPFYESLFGWTTAEVPGSDGLYRSIAHEGRNIGGIMRAQREIAQPYWTVYFGVADVDVTLERVTAEGGRTLVEPMAVPSGRFAVALDPQGAVFCLVDGEFDD